MERGPVKQTSLRTTASTFGNGSIGDFKRNGFSAGKMPQTWGRSFCANSRFGTPALGRNFMRARTTGKRSSTRMQAPRSAAAVSSEIDSNSIASPRFPS